MIDYHLWEEVGSYKERDRYVNPFTDFGFKRLFGEEPSKEILVDFLNTLLAEEQGPIRRLSYRKNERLGALDTDRRAIFDLYCENERGEKFIVEMQKAKHNFFKERSVFYSTFPIREQAEKGEWDFDLKAVYTIGILDFVFDEDKDDTGKYCYRVKLSDIETHRVFYDKLTFIYLEMPKFQKTEEELETPFDKWMFAIRNLANLRERPERLQDRIFRKFFEIAEIARFTPEQLSDYEESLKVYRDLKGVVETARQDGLKKGMQEGLQKGIQEGLQQGIQEGLQQGIQEGLQQGMQKGLQKGMQEGRKKGREEGREEGQQEARLQIARKLLLSMPPEEVSTLTGLSPEDLSPLLP